MASAALAQDPSPAGLGVGNASRKTLVRSRQTPPPWPTWPWAGPEVATNTIRQIESDNQLQPHRPICLWLLRDTTKKLQSNHEGGKTVFKSKTRRWRHGCSVNVHRAKPRITSRGYGPIGAPKARQAPRGPPVGCTGSAAHRIRVTAAYRDYKMPVGVLGLLSPAASSPASLAQLTGKKAPMHMRRV